MVGYGLSVGRVDTDLEVLKETYATAYDSINKLMVEDGRKHTLNLPRLKSTFARLKSITRRYAPHKLHFVERLEMYALQHARGKLTDREFLVAVRTIAEANGLDTSLIAQAEMRVNTLEARVQGKAYNPFVWSDKPIAKRPIIPGDFSLVKGDTFFKMPKEFFSPQQGWDFVPPKAKQPVLKPIAIMPPVLPWGKPSKGKPFLDIKPLDFGKPLRPGKPMFDLGKPFFDAKPLVAVPKARKGDLRALTSMFIAPVGGQKASKVPKKQPTSKLKGMFPGWSRKLPRWF